MSQNLFSLSRYLGRVFLVHFAIIYAGLLSIVYVFDLIELIRRFAKRDGVEFGLAMIMSLYKLPEVGLKILPFAIFFGAIFALWRMTKSHELIVMRASGVSAWQFTQPLIITVIILGCLKLALLNPISSVLLQRYDVLEGQHLSNTESLVDLSKTGLWLKQPSQEQTIIVHAPKVNTPEWSLENVIIFYYNNKNEFQARIDAGFGIFEANKLKLRDVYFHPAQNDESTRYTEDLTIDIQVTPQDIERRFTSPQSVSFWSMPSYINTIKATGFPANKLEAQFYSLMAEPLLYVALVLLAGILTLRPPRQNNTMILVIGSIFIPFTIFFLGDLLAALGISEKLPLSLAAFAPALICLCIGTWGILHLEDG